MSDKNVSSNLKTYLYWPSITDAKKEEKLKELEAKLKSEKNFNDHTKCRNDIEYIYENAVEGVKIKSKCQWYEKMHNQLKKVVC